MESTAVLWHGGALEGSGPRPNHPQSIGAPYESACEDGLAALMASIGLQWTSPRDSASSEVALTHSDGTSDLNNANNITRHVCELCPRTFSAAKSLYRHRRSVHDAFPLALECTYCGLKCSRKDTLDRHIREKHVGTDDRLDCPCGRKIARRGYREHQKTAKCRKARLLHGAEDKQLGLFKRWEAMMKATRTTPCYLDAPVDAIMVAAELFLKFKPWGRNNYWRYPNYVNTTPNLGNIEVLQLKDVVFQAVRKQIASPSVARDPSLPSALAMLVIISALSDGWTTGLVHAEGLKVVAAMQIEEAGFQAFVDVPLPDVFHTVALRNVPNSDIASCETMIREVVELMRFAAAEIVSVMGLKSSDRGNPAWREASSVSGAAWFDHYRPRLSSIAEIAESLEGDEVGSGEMVKIRSKL